MSEWPTCWHPFDREADDFPDLEDHCYYLVTDVRFGTPMKAKWHTHFNAWEIKGVPTDMKEYFYTWDADCPVIAWCELPPVYKPESSSET